MKKGFYILALGFFIARTGLPVVESHETMQEVLKIAHGISVVQPNLPDAEYVSLAIGIHRAAKKYSVHPSVMIAITQQESGFRSNLPEGAAGEIGICQIIKSWLKNPNLIREFGPLTVADLQKPATSFKVSAWILSELKDASLSGPLPFWSFYNSREFKNRFKYFLKVTRNLSALRKHAPSVYSDSVLVAAGDSSGKAVQWSKKQSARDVASDRKLPDALKAARMLHPRRLSQRTIGSLLKTASLN